MTTRDRIYKLIDQLPDTAMNDIQAMLQDYMQYNTIIPRLDGLPVYDVGNPDHARIIIDRHVSKDRKLKLVTVK